MKTQHSIQTISLNIRHRIVSMSSKLKHLGSRSCLVAFTFTTYESKERDSVQALPLLSLSFSRTAAPLFALHCMHALNANQTKPLSLSLSLSLFYAIFNSHAVLQFFFFLEMCSLQLHENKHVLQINA